MVTAVLLLAVLAQGYTPPGQAQAPCVVSSDPTYGVSPENPIQVGGGALYVKAREERYLNALRGPNGEPITFTRRGSLEGPRWGGRTTILDAYEVTYDGAPKPLTLYLDAYHYWEQQAPAGLTCSRPFDLQPILDSFLASESLLAVAMQTPPTAITPIPLSPDPQTNRGAMWDGFRLLALATGGAPAAPTSKPQPPGTLVVAYPLSCGGRTIAPTAVQIVTAQQKEAPRIGGTLSHAEIEKMVGGGSIPHGSIGARFQLQQIRPTDAIRIAYAEAACPDNSAEVTLPIKYSAARAVDMPQPPIPEGVKAADTRVLVQVIVDLDGGLQRPHYAGGPPQLIEAAREAVKSWRAEPARVNGVPVPAAMLVLVPFK